MGDGRLQSVEVGEPYRGTVESKCDHGLTFPQTREGESAVFRYFEAFEVREVFPRLNGACPKGCGYYGIAYVTMAHYVAGDW